MLSRPRSYATPGVHDKADSFNRVQRGHQNFIETQGPIIACALVGGLKHPYTCAKKFDGAACDTAM